MIDLQNVAGQLAAYRGRRVEFTTDGDTLRWRAPRGVLTDDDRAWFRSNKAAILTALKAGLGWDRPFGCHSMACRTLGPCAFYVPGVRCNQR